MRGNTNNSTTTTMAVVQQTSYYFSDENCGTMHTNQKKIPWVAKVFVRQKLICGASFISKTRAVTTAKCLEDGVKAMDIHLFIFSFRCKKD